MNGALGKAALFLAGESPVVERELARPLRSESCVSGGNKGDEA
ncbi:hypothetical protein ABLA30_14795 [Xenorhabdus nematophila]